MEGGRWAGARGRALRVGAQVQVRRSRVAHMAARRLGQQPSGIVWRWAAAAAEQPRC